MAKKILISLLVTVGVFVLLGGTHTPPALAQNCEIGNLSGCKGDPIIPMGTEVCETATQCVNWIVNVIFIVAVLASFIYLVLGGIQYITAGGDENKVGKARSTITNAVIGLVVVIVAWAISNFVLSFFGISGGPLAPTTSSLHYVIEG